jgi:malate dehydrogenase (oxaloacetate-decarboxylating)(NADP+)
MLVPAQANNVYIFPAIGMAVYATEAKRVTDEMFIVAARAVAEQVADRQLEQGMLYPPQSNMLATETNTAARVAELVFDRGLARAERPTNIKEFIQKLAYRPTYSRLT